MSSSPLIKLASGYSIPQVGLGTWMSKAGEVQAATKVALKAGYRHIDTAHCYGNHAEIGVALKQSIQGGVVKRSDVFVTSKVWNTYHTEAKTIEAVDLFLDELQLEYLDLVLIHWPMGYEEGGEMFPTNENGSSKFSTVDYLDTWRGLQACVKSGQVRSIGVSNFNAEQVQRVIDAKGAAPCSMNQIEIHPYFPQDDLVKLCQANNIQVTAYSPLANNAHIFRKEGERNLLEEPTLKEIAATHKKSTAQVVLRWFVQKGLVVIPKSVTESRIVENFDVFDISLNDEEMAVIDALSAVDWRILKLEHLMEHPHYPFH